MKKIKIKDVIKKVRKELPPPAVPHKEKKLYSRARKKKDLREILKKKEPQ